MSRGAIVVDSGITIVESFVILFLQKVGASPYMSLTVCLQCIPFSLTIHTLYTLLYSIGAFGYEVSSQGLRPGSGELV